MKQPITVILTAAALLQSCAHAAPRSTFPGSFADSRPRQSGHAWCRKQLAPLNNRPSKDSADAASDSAWMHASLMIYECLDEGVPALVAYWQAPAGYSRQAGQLKAFTSAILDARLFHVVVAVASDTAVPLRHRFDALQSMGPWMGRGCFIGVLYPAALPPGISDRAVMSTGVIDHPGLTHGERIHFSPRDSILSILKRLAEHDPSGVMRRLAAEAEPWLRECSTPPTRVKTGPADRIERVEAVISDTLARFVFPIDTVAEYVWNSASAIAYPGLPLFYWNLDWITPYDRRGIDPDGLALVVRWQTGGLHRGSLQQMLTGRPIDVYTWCLSCGTPAQIPSADPAVSFVVIGRRVEFVVTGRDAIRRIFPKLPDSVTFVRGDQSGRSNSVSAAIRSRGH